MIETVFHNLSEVVKPTAQAIKPHIVYISFRYACAEKKEPRKQENKSFAEF